MSGKENASFLKYQIYFVLEVNINELTRNIDDNLKHL